jgi:uncharacterized membrane protein
MESKAKLFGHPIHPMLIVFPLGLLVTSVGFDIAYLIGGESRWADFSYWLIGIGIATGLLAAVFGLIDYLAIPEGTRARRIGMLHGGGNAVVLGLFAVSFWLRSDNPMLPEATAIVLSIAAVLLAGVTGWLGAELVYRLGIGEDDGANVNAPSSLTTSSGAAGRA